MTLVVIAVYLSAVLSIGLLSHRLFRGTSEDYFVATRSIGPFILLMSLFGTNMTAFKGRPYGTNVAAFKGRTMAASSLAVCPYVSQTPHDSLHHQSHLNNNVYRLRVCFAI